jgi:hypothetical protein
MLRYLERFLKLYLTDCFISNRLFYNWLIVGLCKQAFIDIHIIIKSPLGDLSGKTNAVNAYAR